MLRGLALSLLPLIISGCAVQSTYAPARLRTPADWLLNGEDPFIAFKDGTTSSDTWWTALNDHAIDTLVSSALSDSPTLAVAVARIEEARAGVTTNSASRLPRLGLEIGAVRERESEDGRSRAVASGDAGVTLGWELDLFGRVRHSIDAARSRLDGRNAEAQGARLALAAQVADGVVSLRACMFSEVVQTEDIDARSRMVHLMRQRLAVGAVAPVDESSAVSTLAAARTRATSQHEQCARQVHLLTMLSGQESAVIKRLIEGPGQDGVPAHSGGNVMPRAPEMALALPADVLLSHPDVIVAEREVSAAWEERGSARAARYPRIDLGGFLGGSMLSAGGSSLTYGAWSLLGTLTAPVFDGGAGAANVDIASSRYRSAEATLRQAVRSAAQDVMDALAAGASAKHRQNTAREALSAARYALQAKQAQWDAGAVSLFELEDVRRQFSSAEDDAIAATRDRAQAWIALIKASGNTAVLDTANEENIAASPHD